MRALLTQRWRLLAVLCVLAAGVALGLLLRARPAATPAEANLKKLPPFAIVYSREARPPDTINHVQEIVWQKGRDAKSARVLYRSHPCLVSYVIPDEIGYLPAPTGAWVFVWETVRDEQLRADHTEWWLVRVADGKRYPVATAKGASGIFPHWYGESDVWLDLTKGDQKWQVDLRGATPKLAGSLPRGGEDTRDIDEDGPQAQAWREAFIRGSFDADRTVAEKVLAKLGSDPHAPVEDLLLWPMGIVSESGPELAASPSKRQVARSETARAEGKSAEARLDVYDVATGTRVWGRTVAEVRFFHSLHWSPDGRLFSFTQGTTRGGDGVATVVDAATGAEVTHLDRATNAFVIPIVGEKQGKPVIPCACTLKEHK